MADGLQALVVGSDVFYPSFLADGKIFHFKNIQNQFMIAHQKTRSVEMAALSVGKDEEWAKKFLSSAKFKKFVYSKMAQFSAQNGMTVEWWYAFGKQLTDGYVDHYEYACSFCQFSGEINTYEAETYRDDDLQLRFSCQSCFKATDAKLVHREFKPTREQVEGWKELGSRIIPKIERVHHQYENTEILFQNSEEVK